jgi:hypothetical protein
MKRPTVPMPKACVACGSVELEPRACGLWDSFSESKCESGIVYGAACLKCGVEMFAYDTDEAEEAGKPLTWIPADSPPPQHADA